MENRPPQQDTPRRPPPVHVGQMARAVHLPPPWLWLLLIGGFAIIFWQFMPKPATPVDYNPWFLDQVDSDNIKKVSVQGSEVQGRAAHAADH